MRENRRAFMLIELIIVMAILGIVAAIATPIMTGIKKRAIESEAVTVLGTIRSSYMKPYIVEYNEATDSFERMGIKLNDLVGRYFTKRECYSVDISSARPPIEYTLICDSRLSDNPEARDLNILYTMDQSGNISSTSIGTGTGTNTDSGGDTNTNTRTSTFTQTSTYSNTDTYIETSTSAWTETYTDTITGFNTGTTTETTTMTDIGAGSYAETITSTWIDTYIQTNTVTLTGSYTSTSTLTQTNTYTMVLTDTEIFF
jgi:prepilin-type N-terminal cleavage/methylation domain-containing protein